VTSHRTTTKILLTALLITLITGTAAALEITSPSDGSYHNSSITFQIETEAGSYDSIEIRKASSENGEYNRSQSVGSSGEVSWTPGTDGSYYVKAVNTSSSDETTPIRVVYDTTPVTVSGLTVEKKYEDGSIEISFNNDNDLSGIDHFVLNRTEESTGESTIRNIGAATTYNDTETDYTTYTYTVWAVDRAGNAPSESARLDPSSSDYVDSVSSINVIDGLAPTIVDRSPGQDAYISSTSQTVSVEVEDLLSGLKNATLTVGDNSTSFNESNIPDSGTLNLEINDLDERAHNPQVTVYDQQGNNRTYSWEFTVDTQKPDPSASLSPSPDGQEFLTTATPLQVEVDEEDVSPTKVERIECHVDDPRDYSNEFGSSSEYSDGSFRCGELDPGDYSEGSHSIYVEFYDRAGNKQVSNLGEYVFDTVNPEIESLTVTPEYTNTEPNVTVEASDFGSGVEDAEYMFSENVEDGEGNTISEGFEDGEMSFQPNLRNKEDGDYELFVRVQDGSGKWSDAESVNFTLDRGALPEPELETEGTLNVTSGDSTFFDVTVSNNGKVPLTNAQLEFIGDVEGTNKGIEVKGESSKDVSIRASTNRSFGQTQVTLKLTNSAVSENVTVPVNIRASDEQKQQVDERIKQYETRLGLLKQNLTQLEEDGADQQLIEDMDTQIREFESRLEQVNSSVAEGRYYEIASSIDEVETQRSEAVNTTEQAKEEHRQNEKRFWMILFGLLTLGVLGGGAFVWYRSDYYLDMDDLPVDLENMSLGIDFDSWDDFVERVEEKLDNLMEGGEEEESSGDSKDLAWN
jgi:hypothetical protein